MLAAAASSLAVRALSNDFTASSGDTGANSTAAVDFARDIQPILARCVHCHGPETAESGLRLDEREAALGRRDSGRRAIAPGNSAQSELLRRVSTDEAERMPPEGEPLTAKEIDRLRLWIESGAHWPAHWAYEPLELSEPPAVNDPESWIRNPIDPFVLKKLHELGLRPAPAADRRTLIRRLYFDLLGLPPLPSEIDAFLADDSPNAYEKLVDRLLASPQYGERWARHWMDIVHYADSHGFEHDLPRESWPYRDYLVRAFNADKPYAQFIREQIAGDALQPISPDAITATGFLAAGPWDQSTLQASQMETADHRLGQYLDRDDILSTAMSTFISTTVHCARCHDHKFDPITQADYYALQAVFAGIDKATRLYDPDPEVAQKRNRLESHRMELQQQVEDRVPALLAPALQAQVEEWENRVRAADADWHLLEPVEYRSARGAGLVKQTDASLLSTGNRPDTDVYTVTLEPPISTVTAIRLELMTDESLPFNGPGRQDNGNMHLSEFVVRVAPRATPEAAREVPLTNAQADFNQVGWSTADAIDKKPETAWAIYPEVGCGHTATFDLAEPLPASEPITLIVELHQSQGSAHLIGRFRIAVTSRALPRPPSAATLPAPVSAALTTPSSQRSQEQRMLLARFYLERQIDQELAELPEQKPLYCGTNRFETKGSFHPATMPRDVYILERGEIGRLGALARPAALRLIRGLPAELEIANPEDESQRRVALANWLADPRNVLTWRSIANRVWQYHFGQGLVETPNDFGRIGAAPSHPELLDWLAATLRDNGGSLKSLHRVIVTSAAYRQASKYSEAAAKIDGGNRFLWRMNTRRLDAESIRDAVLRLSGKLNHEMGGPPVKHFREIQALGQRPEADYQQFDLDSPAANRRSIYRFIFRTIPDPFMAALDCPDGSQHVPVRNVSITALQALAMLNDKLIIHHSEHIAEQLQAQHASRPKQIQELYRLLLGRGPDEREFAAVSHYADRFRLANACRFLLNTNEFMFVE